MLQPFGHRGIVADSDPFLPVLCCCPIICGSHAAVPSNNIITVTCDKPATGWAGLTVTLSATTGTSTCDDSNNKATTFGERPKPIVTVTGDVNATICQTVTSAKFGYTVRSGTSNLPMNVTVSDGCSIDAPGGLNGELAYACLRFSLCVSRILQLTAVLAEPCSYLPTCHPCSGSL